ncbi:hypothetical protein LIER_04727 [Lithospermum erythrorhizon]|uniref:Pectinesterase inhibitor domain-containing protein n=1 Tax=Lithospermum erythrorhizon TaxID=34254 RepID=A0AAV3NY18_LITER
MAKLTMSMIPIVLVLLYITCKIESTSASATTSFIRSKCSSTTYPSLCFQTLSSYASTIQTSQHQLVQTALSVSVERAQATQSFMKKLAKFKGLKAREYAAIKDCLEEMSDDVDRLSKSVKELKGMGKDRHGADFMWHMSNIETWVSAALTDGTTCMDGFSGKTMNARIRSSIRTRVTNVAQVTSNALVLVNQYAGAN